MLKIAICDDSNIEQQVLKQLLYGLLKKRNITGYIECFSSGEEFLEKYESGMFSLLFLDIYMAEMNGIETAKIIRKSDTDLEIVYCTSSADFALEGYEVFAFGYLLKPFDKMKTETLLNYYLKKNPIKLSKYVVIKTGRNQQIIYYKNIVYMESDDKVVFIHMMNGSEVKTYEKMNSIEERLDDRFLRIHQSYIINMDFISRVDESNFITTDESLVPIRKRGKKSIVESYMSYVSKRMLL